MRQLGHPCQLHTQVATTQRGIADSFALDEEEVASGKEAARAAAAKEAQAEAAAWVEEQKAELRQRALDAVKLEVSECAVLCDACVGGKRAFVSAYVLMCVAVCAHGRNHLDQGPAWGDE